MKMYEKLGIDLTTEEGFIRLFNIHCSDIPDGYGGIVRRDGGCPNLDRTCGECKAKRLFAEVPTKIVKRWETIQSDKDVE